MNSITVGQVPAAVRAGPAIHATDPARIPAAETFTGRESLELLTTSDSC